MALTNTQVLAVSGPLRNAATYRPYADDQAGQLPLTLLAAAVLRAALMIATDASTEVNYTNRQKWVNAVTGSVNGPLDMAARMHLAVCVTDPVATDLAGGGTPSDADVLSTVAALIDTFAGRI
ncbi:MAG: hypothetical protein LC772_02115 [Chloroflexi bacterium]|nr:hypothetical protein [Chloroflexota bacterium]